MVEDKKILKAIEILKANGYVIDLENETVYSLNEAVTPNRNAVAFLECVGFWIDIPNGIIKPVSSIDKAKHLECLANDKIDNKLAVLKYIKNNYSNIKDAFDDGYTVELVNKAFDFVDEYKKNKEVDKKTYIFSDIHGMYGSYCDVIKSLKEDDMLYILGDVIDRGNGGIQILQDIMKRKNVRFLLGNHELMMINCLDIIKKYDLSYEEIEKFVENVRLQKWINSYTFDLKTRAKTDEEREKYTQKIDDCRNRVAQNGDIPSINKMTLDDREILKNWLCDNRGEKTLKSYMRLEKKERKEIYNYLTKSVVIGSINIKNNNYLLVHSRPFIFDRFVKERDKEMCFSYEQLKRFPDHTYYMLWERDDSLETVDTYKWYKDRGFTTICGHTPSDGIINDMRATRGALRIDAGSGHRGGKLAVYCVEDDTVKYLPAKEYDYQGIGE